jgi:hypothetical protein
MAIMGPISDIVAIFPQRIGHVVRGEGGHAKSFFLRLFIASTEPNCFTSSAVTPQGYKAGLVSPVQPTSSRTISLYSSTSFTMAEKKKTEK